MRFKLWNLLTFIIKFVNISKNLTLLLGVNTQQFFFFDGSFWGFMLESLSHSSAVGGWRLTNKYAFKTSPVGAILHCKPVVLFIIIIIIYLAFSWSARTAKRYVTLPHSPLFSCLAAATRCVVLLAWCARPSPRLSNPPPPPTTAKKISVHRSRKWPW